MNELLQRMYDFSPKVAVCGDAMVDEYYEVRADKVSPEFPIPVLLSDRNIPVSASPGGASNVCAQMMNFNVEASLFALTNERIKEMSSGVNMEGCMFTSRVPVKRRYYSGGFPLCRLDEETKNYGLSDDSLKDLQAKILGSLFSSGPYDVVVFSDYDKGFFCGVSDLASRVGDAITIVDPKRGPLERWGGCTIIKPNAKEARELTGLDDWRDQCSHIMDRTGCQAVVITNAGEGVFGNVQGIPFEHKPQSLVSARSVIGAGDCFVAFLAMCMCHSIDIRRAVSIAFEACSVYVSNDKNRPLHPYQIAATKLVDPRMLARRDFSLAFSNGCFDVLHPGHVELLSYARSRAEALVVALNSDESAALQNKSHPLVNDLSYRKSMVAALGCVDFVLDFAEPTPYELIKKVMPDVLVKGSDWPDPVGSDLVREVCSFGLVGGHSTTELIRKIASVGSK